MRLRLAASLCALLAVAGCGGDDDGEGPDAAPPTGPATVHVERYAYELDLETRAASTRLTLRVVTPGDCITLPSRAPMLDLGAVTLDGAAARTATADGVTLTACGAGWAAGATVTLGARMTQPLEHWRDTQVGYTVTNDAGGQPMFYLVSWVGGCDRFGPCDPTPSVFAHYELTVHHRAGITALCPGRITAGATTTTCTFDYAGGPTYSTFGLVASGSWTVTALGTWGGVTATLYDRPGSSSLLPLIDSAYHQGFLAWMVATFGPYPYGTELRIASGPTYWSGFEHPGNVVLDTGLNRPMSSLYTRPVGHVLNHELAHQWAGDQTTLAETYDFVWKEAMAEYLAFVYEDMINPVDALATARAWKTLAVGAAYFPVPEDVPRPTLLDYYGEVYGPGPMILFRQLETLSSRAQVIAGIKMVLGAERALSVAEVQAALEAATGLDLDTYFDIWVRGAGAPAWPTFRVEITGVAPTQQLVVTETTAGGVRHGCDFAVELRGAGGESVKVPVVRGVDGAAVVTVATGVTWAVASTVLDPDAQCLAYAAAALTAAPRHPPGWSPWRSAP